MKLITRDTDYALRAVCFIAGNKQRITTAKELVKALRIPRPFLRKVLQVLNKKRILKSYRGLGGGFALAGPAQNILLTDLMRAFQGPFQLNECAFKKRICPQRKGCGLKKRIDKIEKYVARQLALISIADLIRANQKG